jgi:hypothetical protein|tara:strand:- start:7434 stop:9281 length:1848 start_codon:yes stop_codon:yes gene_type:complete
MADQNRRIKVAELDFDGIKTNLKNYLRGQSQFSDFDFEGAGISVLLDVLAYNTHYNALYHNMSVNEMFLDSAAKRESVVSIGKMLGYTPKSAICPTATIQLVVSNVSGNPDTLTLPTASTFTSTVDGTAYTFQTTSAYTASKSSTNTYTFPAVVITEGTMVTNTYTAASNTRYLVANANADMTSLGVSVQEDPNNAAYLGYTLVDNIVNAGPSSRVFFTKEVEDKLYEVEFGDGAVGFAPPNGATVKVSYCVSSLTAANGSKLFTYTGGGLGSSTVNITTTSAASGGADQESIDSIKFNAPKSFAAQNRAVTADDYKVILPQLYDNVDAISVWGGEENDPPVYGKAYISIKPKSGTTLTESTKLNITNNIIKSKNLVSVIPEIVDPDTLGIIVQSTVYYNQNVTSKAKETIASQANAVVQNFNTANLNKFDSVFRFSALSKEIDASDVSIISNSTQINLKKVLTPTLNVATTYTLPINNPIYNDAKSLRAYVAISSTGFTLSGSNLVYFLEDDALGNIYTYYLTGGNEKVYSASTVGTVNYETGLITLNNLSISGTTLSNGTINISIEPSSYDVVSVRNQLASIANEDIVVSAIADKVASGESTSSADYVHTKVR